MHAAAADKAGLRPKASGAHACSLAACMGRSKLRLRHAEGARLRHDHNARIRRVPPDVLDHGTSARGVWKFPLVASCRISLSYPIAKCQRLLPRIGVGWPTATMVFSVAPIRGVLVMKTIGSALIALTDVAPPISQNSCGDCDANPQRRPKRISPKWRRRPHTRAR